MRDRVAAGVGVISIHAPRTGSDRLSRASLFFFVDFNPRSPHGERRFRPLRARRRAPHFNPRSPHGERRRYTIRISGTSGISIHAPRTGSDCISKESARKFMRISIHAPRTGSDPTIHGVSDKQVISIHAPRTGSDPR